MRKTNLRLAIAIASMTFAAAVGRADELKFGFINPSFGGNPFNSAHLLGVAQAQSTFKDDLNLDFGGLTSGLQDSLNRAQTRIVGNTLVQTSVNDEGNTVVDIVDLTTGEITQVIIP